MTLIATDKDTHSYLVHDIEALHTTMHFRLCRVNDEIRRINKQPYIHKQVDCLERFKEQRKLIDKLISKISDLLLSCKKSKSLNDYSNQEVYNEMYKTYKDHYFKLQ